MSALFGLVAAIAAALITRSVMISNHRQAWINGLREDLAKFFASIDAIHFHTNLSDKSSVAMERKLKAREEAQLTYRKILMRLNMSESLHQQLERSLNLLQNEAAPDGEIAATVKLARVILKQEWEVTKYGPFTELAARFKARRRKGRVSSK